MNDLQSLIDCWLDSVITEEQAQALNFALGQSEVARRDFGEQVQLHYLMRESYSSDASLAAVLMCSAACQEEVDPVWQGVERLRERSTTKRFRLWPVAAMLMFVVAGVIFSLWARQASRVLEPQEIAARDAGATVEVEDSGSSRTHEQPFRAESERSLTGQISRSVNVQWPFAQRWSVGDRVAVGDVISLQAGRVELVLDNETVLVLVGPAELEVLATDRVVLHSGTVTTRINDEKGRNFHVLTPTTEVIDLGTEFGVRVDPEGETDVVVFDGVVDITPLSAAPDSITASQRLLVGEAARVRKTGEWERIVSVLDDAYPFGDRLFPPTRRRPPVIVGVSDDRRNPNSPKFYRICQEGLNEDARAYVDRLHEWNGVTQEGMPHFLRGADYIATFNDDKLASPSITIELAQPAMVYVLFDTRLPPPDWLVKSFEDTGALIGVDESNLNTPQMISGIGPGVSINNTHSIWMRRVETPGKLTLGPMVTESQHRVSMYGIAAQPIE